MAAGLAASAIFAGIRRPAVHPLVRALAVTLACAACARQPAPPAAKPPIERMRDEIEKTVGSVDAQRLVPLKSAAARQRAWRSVVDFYRRRGHWPAWTTADGALASAEKLVGVLGEASARGFDADGYGRGELARLLAEVPPAAAAAAHRPQPAASPPASATPARPPVDLSRLVELDLRSTASFLAYATQVLQGRIDPDKLDPQWKVAIRTADLSALLEEAIRSGELQEALDRLEPHQPGYRRLKLELHRYRAMEAAGGWPEIPEGPKLEAGRPDGRVPVLRRRLAVTGELSTPSRGEAASAPTFDARLAEAVRAFQRRHGLKPDGTVGGDTLAELNVPVDERIEQIEVNLERWRWLPDDLGERYVLVNVPAYELELVDDRKRVATMRVIVGKTYKPTPVFTGEVDRIVLNPYWNVPRSIAREEILKALKRDPSYLARNDMEVLQKAGSGWRRADPASIHWRALSAESLPYRFRQRPGDKNSLGRVKFEIPNSPGIYLHGTPADQLFKRTERGLSHGCIRLERPVDLAAHMTRSDPRWTRQAIEAAIEAGDHKTIRLERPFPVYIVYQTAWVGDGGELEFREDVYGTDEVMADELYGKPAP